MLQVMFNVRRVSVVYNLLVRSRATSVMLVGKVVYLN